MKRERHLRRRARAVSIALGLSLSPLLLSVAYATDELESRDVQDLPAEDAPDGPEFAVRSGYATGFGNVERGAPLRDSMAGAVPLWVDVGYRLNRDWFIGAYAHYGLGIASGTSESDCSGCQHTWVRFGAQAQRRWSLDSQRALWIGLGLGRESFNTSIDTALKSSRSIAGWELFNWQFGCDFQPTSGLSVGPYFSLSFDMFSTKTQRCTDNSCPRAARNVATDLNSSGAHGWVNAGLRIVFLP